MRKPEIAFLLILLLAGAGLVAFALWGGAPAKPGDAAQAGAEQPAAKALPNVVLVVLDALRADRVEAERNGAPVMPWLRDFAARARYFPAAVSPCSWTRPAMASLFTGLYVDTHQVYFSGEPGAAKPRSDKLPEGHTTLAEYLGSHGYQTAAVQTNGNLQEEFGFTQGFGHVAFSLDANADWVGRSAAEALTDLGAPFFLYLHYMDTHAPYQPPAEHRAAMGAMPALSEQDKATMDGFWEAETPAARERFWQFFLGEAEYLLGLRETRPFPELSDAGKEWLRMLYDGEARFMDAELGKTMDAILAAHPDTLVVIMADHGEQFWEHGGIGHGTSLFEEELRVPLVIAGPGIVPARVETLATTLDLLPTLADALGLEALPQWERNQSLLEGIAEEPHFARTRGSWPSLGVDLEAAYAQGGKLIHDNRRDMPLLFDLREDPGEGNNLAGAESHADLLAAVSAARARHAHASRFKRAELRVDSVEVELDPELEEQMRAMGYGPSSRGEGE